MSTNIIALLSGVLIVFTGVVLAGAGIALGLQTVVPTVPPWVFFLGFGLVAVIVGGVMIYYGKERTIKTVERKLTLKDLSEKHPVALLSVAMGAGLILGSVSKRASVKRKVVAEAKEQLDAFAEANLNEVAAKQHSWRNKIQQIAISSVLQALTVGLQTVAIPFAEKMLVSWWQRKEETHAAQQEHNGAAEPAQDQPHYSRRNGARF